MELTFLQQSQAFLYSLLLGLFIGLLYDAFKILRVAFCQGKISVFILDFLFMIVAFISIYIFSIAYLLGFVRIFLIAGTFSGFIIFRLTIGKILSKLYCPLIRFIKKILSGFFNEIKKITKKLLKIAANILYNKNNSKSILKRSRDNPKGNKDRVNNEKNKEKYGKDKKKLSGFSSGRRKRHKRD